MARTEAQDKWRATNREREKATNRQLRAKRREAAQLYLKELERVRSYQHSRIKPISPKYLARAIAQCRECRERASIGLWPCDRHNGKMP
jgi:hypothetical protein